MSIIDICNTALAHIKVMRIDSLNEASEAARMCKLFYNKTVEEALRDFNWNFAVRTIRLALTPDEIPFWRFIYQYPSDCLHVRKIFGDTDISRTIYRDMSVFSDEIEYPDKYRIMLSPVSDERRICTNIPNASMEYTANIKNTDIYDSKFIVALSWHLAANLAMPLTANPTLAQYCGQTYDYLIGKSKEANANEGYDNLRKPYDYIRGRE